jgi:hypothetical protein
VQLHNGNGKRWLLIGALILGVFWIINDSYQDGYTDALIETGQVTNVRRFDRGPDFPWGLLIVSGIAYVAWRKGAFDRFGGPGGPFSGGDGNGQRGMQRYGTNGGAGYGAGAATGGADSGQGFGPVLRGPRGFFEEWHRQAHESMSPRPAAPPTPPAPAPPRQPQPPFAPAAAPAAGNGNNGPQGAGYAPAPSAPAPEYWAAMARESGAGGDGGNSATSSTPPRPPVSNV